MSDRNPFRPDTGGSPPYLAGRAAEQAALDNLFGCLRKKAAPGGFVVLYGPPGNGKTALLAWAQQQVGADESLDGTWLTAADIATPRELGARVRSTSRMQGSAPPNPSIAGIGVGIGNSIPQPPLAEVLKARSNERPFVMLVDEAHTISAEVARVLLNAAQTAGRDSPFLLVLAGAPDIEDQLAGIGVSFWHRAKILPIGRLGPEAVAEAVERPFAAEGGAVEPDALERIVKDCCGYPYFAQSWGQIVWDRTDASSDGGRRVTRAVVEEAASEFETERNRCYRSRCGELERDDSLPAAREVGLAFRGRERLRHAELREAIRRAAAGGDGPDEKTVARAPRHLGLVWQGVDGTPVREPGIPGLMDYILENAPSPASA